VNTVVLSAEQAEALQLAVQALRRGELVAFPTDTVYGVGVLAFDSQAIERLFVAKDRALEKAIPILIGSLADLPQVVSHMNDRALRLAQRFWPGPLTLVMLRHPGLPANLAPLPTIGVRMPDHPVALALLRETGPLAVTSANLSGGANTYTAVDVQAQLEGRITIILNGGSTPGGQPSTVLDCTGLEPVILRKGPISLGQILEEWK
jgi:L-threonylcarbamoyladenylate synthase